MGRLIGIDYGRKRVGMALSDPTGIAVEPYGFIERESDEQVAAVVTALAKSEQVTAIVIGLPLHANGDAGEAAFHARRFAGILAKTCPLPIHEQDERHSSSEAEHALQRMGQWPAAPGVVDARAAAIILRRFLDGEDR